MRKIYLHILFFAGCFIIALQSFSQYNTGMPQDSTLQANSEKWKVKPNRKMFGIAAPAFGPFKTINAEKMDSPVLRSTIKGGRGFSFELSRSESNMNHTREVTHQVRKNYRLQLTGETDTTEAVFTIFSATKEQRQTFLGKMISKDDSDNDKVLSNDIKIKGAIINADSIPCEFFYHNYHNKETDADIGNSKKQIIEGYLKTPGDSIYIQPATITPRGIPQKYRDQFTSIVGIQLVNKKGEKIAAFQFSGASLNVWIRKDIDRSLLQVIATMIAVVISG